MLCEIFVCFILQCKNSKKRRNTTYINRKSNYGYTARVYTGKNYALNRLTELARSYITWIAQYNYVCNYPGSYRIWQYGSEYYPGINGEVDTNVMFN